MGAVATGDSVAPKPAPVHFTEAIDYLRNKTRLPTRAWTDLWQDQHARAFVVAGAMKDGLVADFHEAVTKAISEGRTLEDFRKDFDQIVSTHGWSYNGSRGWRSRTIFETNMRSAYSAGRWAQAVKLKTQRPYLRYVHGHPKHPRKWHLKWHNTILPVDHPWWKTHFTPNGWGCQCTIQSLSESDMRRYGYKVSPDPEPSKMIAHKLNTPDGPVTVKVPEGIDPGFAFNPGEGAFGRGANLDAIEKQGGFVKLEAPSAVQGMPGELSPVKTTTQPARVPPSLPDAKPDAKAWLNLLHRSIGGNEAIFADPLGQRVSITDAVVDDLLAKPQADAMSEASYWPYIRELVEAPQEIWVGFVKDKVTGRVALRRRYVKVLQLGQGRVITLVSDEQGGFWQALTSFADPASSQLAKLRGGVLAYKAS